VRPFCFVSVCRLLGLVDGGHFRIFSCAHLGMDVVVPPMVLFVYVCLVLSRFGTLGIEGREIIAPSGLVCALFYFFYFFCFFSLPLGMAGVRALSTNYPSTIS